MKKPEKELPPYCSYLPSGKIRYKPKGGKSHTFDLAKSAPMSEVWTYYNRHVLHSTPNSWAYLCDRFFEDHRSTKLSPRSIKDDHNYAKSIARVFENSDMSKVRTVDFRKWADKRAYGAKGAPHQAHKEVKFVKRVLAFAVEYELLGRDYIDQAAGLKHISLNKEDKVIYRKKLMTLEMFLRIRDHASIETQVAATLSYVTGLRLGDVISIKKTDVDATGIVKGQNKTKAFIRKSITQALLETIDSALALKGHQKNPLCKWLICNKQGQKYTEDGLSSNWQRARRKAYPLTNGAPEGYRTRFHDLRHRGTTDHPGENADFTGHTGSGRKEMAAVYDEASRLPVLSPSLDVKLPAMKVA